MTRSTRFAATAGVTTAIALALGFQVGIGTHPLLGVGIGYFGGTATLCGLWAGPVIPAEQQRNGSQRSAALAGGLAGGLSVPTFVVPMLVLDSGFPTGLSLGIYALSVGLAGMTGGKALLVAAQERTNDRTESTAAPAG